MSEVMKTIDESKKQKQDKNKQRDVFKIKVKEWELNVFAVLLNQVFSC